MKEILETFFINYVNTKKINPDLERRIEELDEIFKAELNKEHRSLILDYSNAHYELLNACAAANFKQGFWLGCELMRELSDC
jgi:hypothetical protein